MPYPNIDSRTTKVLGLLEATKEGVEVYSLKSRLRNWNRFFPGINFGFRKLIYDRSDLELMDKFSEFVQTVRGTTYGFPVISFRLKSVAGTETDIEQKRFFCSELVAKCLKHVGLMENDRASCTYFPRKRLLPQHSYLFHFPVDTFCGTSLELGMHESVELDEVMEIDMSEYSRDLQSAYRASSRISKSLMGKVPGVMSPQEAHNTMMQASNSNKRL